MKKNNGKVDVLLSIYNPNIKYLEKQLQSLDNQTYENMEILIFDDCVKQRFDLSCLNRFIKKKKYRVLPYLEENVGYVKAFEYLVKESTGEYIAFCDQDDEWDPRKIEKCVLKLEQAGTLLVATDRKIIDGEGKVVCESVRHSSNKKYETWNSFEDIGVYNFFTACAPGMSIVMDGPFARSTVPFSEYTGHDKWVIECANACGKLSYLDEPLVSYRRHGKNVSGVLEGIKSKKDYENERIIPHLELIREFQKRYPSYQGTETALKFAEARRNHNIIRLFKYRYLAPDIAKFEIVMAFLPDRLMQIIIRMLQKQRS